MTVQEIILKIETLLQQSGTSRFYIRDNNDEPVMIRVSDHSANWHNNTQKTLSFVSKRTEQRKSAYNQMIDEWEVKDGLTDTYQTIEQVLEWNDIY